MTWREASGRARVHAAVVEHRPEAAGAAFAGGQPYCVALVDLEEGVRIMTNVVGCAPGDVQAGMAVTLTWEPLSDGRRLPLFEAASGGERVATVEDSGPVTGARRQGEPRRLRACSTPGGRRACPNGPR